MGSIPPFSSRPIVLVLTGLVTHNPEFTTVEYYEAFADFHDGKAKTNKVLVVFMGCRLTNLKSLNVRRSSSLAWSSTSLVVTSRPSRTSTVVSSRSTGRRPGAAST